ncbi:hypothetical protein G7Y89_g9820 [Cudoniella acicularis]|uniref:Uncharacterized protein n=1 Tax=Cudoniella acicularis TaxID=354080 RepID=A0A8H4REX4_9HELO|nr:hypothetical protein G7Y89_g9820 [Cudoniella acicularis]
MCGDDSEGLKKVKSDSFRPSVVYSYIILHKPSRFPANGVAGLLSEAFWQAFHRITATAFRVYEANWIQFTEDRAWCTFGWYTLWDPWSLFGLLEHLRQNLTKII